MTRIVAIAAAAAMLLAGCGGNRGDGGASAGGSAAPSMTDAQSSPQSVVVDVTIKGGNVSPTNEQVRAKVKQPIVIRVDSDTADELHVHSTPEHSFPVAVGQGQSFQFTVDMPGRVDVELHTLNKTVATIQVQ